MLITKSTNKFWDFPAYLYQGQDRIHQQGLDQGTHQANSLDTNMSTSTSLSFKSTSSVVIVALVTLCALLLSPVTSAAVLSDQLKEVTGKISTNNNKLQRANQNSKSLEKQLSSTNKEVRQLLRSLRSERSALKAKMRELRKETQSQRHLVNDIEAELIRAQTRLKLAQNSEEKDEIQKEIDLVRVKRKEAQEALDIAQVDLTNFEDQVKLLSIEDNAQYLILSEKQTLLEEDLADSRRSANYLRRVLRGLRKDESKLVAKINAANKAAKAQRTEEQVTDETLAKSNTKEETPAAPEEVPSAYVFVISGEEDEYIDDTLKLEEWVESYGAKFISGSWNDITNNDTSPKSHELFIQQMAQLIRQIPDESNLILIGHGLGGGSIIRVATEVASEIDRRIDYLVTLDPVGLGSLRANIVYAPNNGYCESPRGNADAAADYVTCIRNAERRQITSNVANFYNRWQKESSSPLDFQRKIAVNDITGNKVDMVSSTGKFRVSSTTSSDQRRAFYRNSKEAHTMLLSDAAETLPNLLIEYLR